MIFTITSENKHLKVHVAFIKKVIGLHANSTIRLKFAMNGVIYAYNISGLRSSPFQVFTVNIWFIVSKNNMTTYLPCDNIYINKFVKSTLITKYSLNFTIHDHDNMHFYI
jgi:hypothetical protein